MPVQAVAVALNASLARRLPGIYHRRCARLMGFDIKVKGDPVKAGPVLFVGNHSSYLDIMVLGSVIDGSFVAKAEVSRWPLFGWLARLQNTVFVERRMPQTARQRDDIGARLDDGDRLILFPEGTSDNGAVVLPFRSALFAVAERPVSGAALVVQPFSIAYTAIDGFRIGQLWRPLLAWYGDMALVSHAWLVMKLGHVGAEVRFHEPVTMDRFRDRKALAEYCQGVVAGGVADSNRGAP